MSKCCSKPKAKFTDSDNNSYIRNIHSTSYTSTIYSHTKPTIKGYLNSSFSPLFVRTFVIRDKAYYDKK